MKVVIQWTVILVLLLIYAATLWAVLHPHVSPEYRAFYIDRTATDYRPTRTYNTTPEQGMVFSDPGLPAWVLTTHGLSFRDGGGRAIDEGLPGPAGVSFRQSFYGDICVEVKAYAFPGLAGKDIPVRFGEQEQLMRVPAEGPSTYELQFRELRDAKRLDFLVPPVPSLLERSRPSRDARRVALSLRSLRLVSGRCDSESRGTRDTMH
jgi:hypothetical protein